MDLFFDFDGTLADTSEGIVNCVTYAFEKLGVKPVTADDVKKKAIGPPLEKGMSILLETSDEELIGKGINYFRERYKTKGVLEQKLFPNVKETLEKLNNKGHRLFIATSKPYIFTKKICEEHGIWCYFTDVSGTSLHEEGLSKGERLKNLMTKYQSTKNETLMIGDRQEDVIAANEVGIKCIGALYGFGCKETLIEYGCSNFVETIEEVPEYIDNNF